MRAHAIGLPKCNYTLSNGITIVDDPPLSRSAAIKYCEERSEILAPLRTQEDLDELRGELRDCMDSKHNELYREGLDYMVGLTANNGKGMWSDGVEFDANLHDSLAEGAAPPPDVFNVCYLLNIEREIKSKSKGLTRSTCEFFEGAKSPFLCMIAPPSQEEESSVVVTIVVVVLIVIVLSAAVGFGYMKKERINNKVFGT